MHLIVIMNMVDFYKQNVRNNRDYIIYIKDTNKWYSKNYEQLNTNDEYRR